MYTIEAKENKTAELARHGLLIPEIMPDEFFLGYQCRLAIINGNLSLKETNSLIGRWIRETNQAVKLNAYPVAFSLATLLEISLEEFVHRHTLVALSSSIKTSRITKLKTIDENAALKSLQAVSSIRLRSSACFCKECVKEDMDYLGFSFWRRSHQLVGVDWCAKHNISLYEVHSEDAYRWTPSVYLNTNNYNSLESYNHREHAVISRFSQLMNDVLDLKQTLDFKITSQVILNQSKKHNVRGSYAGSKKTLSDLMIEKLPAIWLQKHFPNLKKEKQGTFVYGFDDIQRPNGVAKSCINTLLAAAVVFESADEAILRLTTHQYKVQNQTKKTNIDHQTFLDEYIKQNGNIKQTATKLDIGYSTAIQKAFNIGLPALTNLDKQTFKALKDFYSGTSLLTIMQTPGINYEAFESVIRTAGSRFSSTIKKINIVHPSN